MSVPYKKLHIENGIKYTEILHLWFKYRIIKPEKLVRSEV